jgi:hypothetical protein
VKIKDKSIKTKVNIDPRAFYKKKCIFDFIAEPNQPVMNKFRFQIKSCLLVIILISGLCSQASSGSLAEPQQAAPGKVTARKLSDENAKPRFDIIAGSFSLLEKAQLRARQYFSKGYKIDLIETSDRTGRKIILVSVGTFSNKDDAKNFLSQFQRDVDPAAWLYSKN